MRRTNRVVLITGAAGFVGSHFVEAFLKETDDDIIGVDCLNYSGTWDRLRDAKVPLRTGDKGFDGYSNDLGSGAFYHPRFNPITWDFRRPAEPNLIKELQQVTHIIHMGAESHVDSSIKDPLKFVRSNVEGTCNVLNLARELKNLELFAYFNTDECFGPAPLDKPEFKGFKETDPHNPKNPYAATKSAGSQIVTSYANTYGLPCIQTYTMNIFGERQHREKFIPLVIRSVLEGERVTIHATPDLSQAGVRSYLHARNCAAAYLWLFDNQPWLKHSVKDVEAYNIVGEQELDNLTLARDIAKIINNLNLLDDRKYQLDYEMVDFHSQRPYPIVTGKQQIQM